MLDVRQDTADTLRTAEWYRTATRWTQLTLAEDDPEKFDPAEWIDIFRRTRSNAACLSAGGYIAYYPSKIPLHYVSRFIGDSDPFGALVDGARALKMHVMARVDPHAIHADAAAAHPEWVAHDASGNPRRHWAFPEVWVTCAYGPYNAEFLPQIVEEIAREYDIDAVFANRWQGHGVCYCPHCRESFHAASGLDLPRTRQIDDPAWRAWTVWRREVLSRLIVHLDETVKAVRPHASFIPNMGGASLMEFELSLIEKHCPFLVIDDQGRHGTEAIWKAGRNGKRIRATFRERPVVLITSVGLEDPVNRWKDSVTTDAEIDAWMTDGIMHGMLPWFTKFNGVVPDPRWIAPVARAFARHAAIEPALAATTPATEIAILDAATTLRHHDWGDRAEAEADEHGVYHALVEAGLPFEFVSDHAMTAEMLARFRLLILPNAVCLSVAQCALLDDFVANGGSLVVMGESATRDADGTPREKLGLGETLGVRLTGAPRGPVKNTYVAFADPAHPIAAGFGAAKRIIGGTRLAAVEPVADAEAPILYIPDFPDLPMEEVYPREAPRGAAVVARQTPAGGRTVHVPWNIGATFHHAMAADHQRLIANIVTWALGRPPMAALEAKGVVDIAVREGEGMRLVTLTNLTNPMMMKGPIRETFPVAGLSLKVRLPEGATGAAAELLLAGSPVGVSVADGIATIAVPRVDLAEAVMIRWS